MATGAELTYQTNASALAMANTIFGNGATVVGATYTGDIRSSAVYSAGQRAPGVVPGDTGVILSTGRVVDFTQSNGDPNRFGAVTTNTRGPNNDPQFNALAAANTYDAAILDVDFIPTQSVMTIRFVFSSEEYPGAAVSQFGDTVGVWINGTTVPLSSGSGRISPTNLNSNDNRNLFQDNAGDAFNTEMDGFTLALSLTIPVNPGVVNSIRIGIADVSDSQSDSNLLIAADSITSDMVAVDDAATLYVGQTKTFDILGNDVSTAAGGFTITHINGVAVQPGQSVVLPSGDVVRLNADGTVTVTADTDLENFNFTYSATDGAGRSDIGIVNVGTVPCFAAGTRIRTPQGDRRVEALHPGDLVLTADEGACPVRWVGRRIVAARGPLAPVRIEAGTFGPHGALLVSPQHRILLRDSRAELLFGDAEVLVAAKDLVDGQSVRIVEGGWVEYVHLLLDRHQILWSEGLATESLLPGPACADGFDDAALAELRAIFPDLDMANGKGYGPAARRALRSFEARILAAAAIAA